MPTFNYKDVWVSAICQSEKQEATEVSSDMEIAKQIVVAPSMEFHAAIKTDVTENNFKTWKYSQYTVIFKILLQSSVNNFRQMLDGWTDRQNQTTPKFSSQNNQFILFLFHWLPEMTGLTKQFLCYSQFGEYYIPWRRKWHPLQYSRKFHGHFQKILENSMDRGAWQATVHRVSKSWTRLSNQTRARAHTHTHTHTRGNQLILLCPGLSQFQLKTSHIQGTLLSPGQTGTVSLRLAAKDVHPK